MKTMKTLITLFFISGVLSNFNIANAQNRWSVEFRPAANFFTRDPVNTDPKTGYGIDGTVAYQFIPHLEVYAGWVWNKFSADQSFAGTNVDFEETGYTFGLQLVRPLTSKINYLIRGGGIYNHIEVENNSGDIIADSGHGLGWQIESGLSLVSDKRWSLTPSLRYRSLSRDVTIEDDTYEINLNYISAGIGLKLFFGK